MDAGFLERLLGGNRAWSGPCTVILDAEASVKSPGPDTIATGGIKSYAPRVSSGRLTADAVCLLKDDNVLLAVEQLRHRDTMGQSHLKQTLTVVDVGHVVGVEYDHADALEALGVVAPPPVRESEYRPGTLVG